ncbi:hypothetical protein [uncultured Duncaniella sp.]|uniref:hypothetical protein n=1 Tax=uncultured Duncaniella sp. TaxID=2768039 RepID=UPI0025D92FDF|nr:hypothetical protein [uncultured Duncaniella sp.]
MRRFLHTLMLVMALVAMAAPTADAQRHNGSRENNSRTERPGHASRPSGSRSREGQPRRPVSTGSQNGGRRSHRNDGVSSRPVNRPNVGNRPDAGNTNTGVRPGNGNNHRPGQTVRPEGNHRPGQSVRPEGNHRPGQTVRPGGNHRPGQAVRPGGSHRPNHGLRPGVRPAPRPPMMRPPHRPHRPVMSRPHYRPVPPPAWRPRRGIPVVRGILGLSFGVAIGTSLDYLYNSGYSVDGYANDIVYLRNVPAMNYVWTDAALYYGSNGLDASSFYYSTPVYDMSRYNSVYTSLVGTYGVPVSVNNTGGMLTSTWFGGNKGYITLSFGAGNAGRFLTTLTLGL